MCIYVCMYVCMYVSRQACIVPTVRSKFMYSGPFVYLCVYMCVCMYMYMCVYMCVYMLENITTEPHAQDISTDILHAWLSGYILQQYIYTYIRNCLDPTMHSLN